MKKVTRCFYRFDVGDAFHWLPSWRISPVPTQTQHGKTEKKKSQILESVKHGMLAAKECRLQLK